MKKLDLRFRQLSDDRKRHVWEPLPGPSRVDCLLGAWERVQGSLRSYAELWKAEE